MSRVLVFNLASRFVLSQFARTDAVDLFRSNSGVTLFDTFGDRQDELSETWPSWPKVADSRPKAMADEIVEHLRTPHGGGFLSVLFIVDTALDILPGTDGEADPPARQVIYQVDRIVQQNQSIHGIDVKNFAVCLGGHRIPAQREAVIEMFSGEMSNFDVDGIFFYENLFHTGAEQQNAAVRLILDLLLKRGADDDGARAFEMQRDFAYVMNLSEPTPTVSMAMRHDFCSHVDGKLKAGSDQFDHEARESAEFKQVDDLIDVVNKTLEGIEKKTVELIEFDIVKPDEAAPIYKTPELLRRLNKQAEAYEVGIRSAAQEHIQDAIRQQQTTSVESAREEADLKRQLAEFSLPAMQFRWSLLQVIRNELQPKLIRHTTQAQEVVTQLRHTVSGFFSPSEQEPEPLEEPNSTRAHPEKLDLSQLQNVVSSYAYHDTLERFLTAAKRLPSKAFAYSIYLLSFIAVWAMAFAWTLGLPPAARDVPAWHYPLLISRRTDDGGIDYFLLTLVSAVYFAMCVCIFFIFSRLRKRVNVSHGNFIKAAADLEKDFRELATQTLAYSKRARTLQLRKSFQNQFQQTLNERRARQFIDASGLLALGTQEKQSLETAKIDRSLYLAPSLLNDETNSGDWIAEYFGETSKFKTGNLSIKISDTLNELEMKSTNFLMDSKVHFTVLREWEP